MEKGQVELSHGGVTEYSSDNTDVEVLPAYPCLPAHPYAPAYGCATFSSPTTLSSPGTFCMASPYKRYIAIKFIFLEYLSILLGTTRFYIVN
jgi:hypothetical protein